MVQETFLPNYQRSKVSSLLVNWKSKLKKFKFPTFHIIYRFWNTCGDNSRYLVPPSVNIFSSIVPTILEINYWTFGKLSHFFKFSVFSQFSIIRKMHEVSLSNFLETRISLKQVKKSQKTWKIAISNVLNVVLQLNKGRFSGILTISPELTVVGGTRDFSTKLPNIQIFFPQLWYVKYTYKKV